jgi:hypothetical protein
VVTKTTAKSYRSRKVATRRYLLSLFIALAFALTIYSGSAEAQVTDGLEANIPFQFHVGNSKLPAGEYRIRVLDDSDLTVMEIISADESTSALFQVQNTDAKSTPGKSELIFNKYGDQYFLAKLFEEGSSSGSRVVKSSHEKKISEQATQAEEHVAAHGRMHQGN